MAESNNAAAFIKLDKCYCFSIFLLLEWLVWCPLVSQNTSRDLFKRNVGILPTLQEEQTKCSWSPVRCI